ncbi:ATP-grasp domain-containing protein [Sporosarcina obsidiansis]|uniref:ATP-grasp domain-containing protein n=1 Tax=Sporosarcina obsidiansis TaxID=2660748 RepID=UPI00129BBBB5|nr:ATP-grasp domain-containing protein [Sporosarcina obsidiansis]
MKGAVYYNAMEAERNQTFIEDLQKESEQIGIQLVLITEPPTDSFDFILFRDRNPKLANELEQTGYHLFNRSAVQEIANDKMRTFELASLLGIPTVPTYRLDQQLPELPLVLKTRGGYGGKEVFLCHTHKEVDEVLRGYERKELIAQPFIEAEAQDVRVFMLGENVVGAVKRTGSNSFKSNFTLGGSVEKYVLDETQTKQVQTIAQAIHSDYIGIDFLLPTKGSWLLNEIEDPVGARSLYVTHDFSVAEKLMCYVKERLEK